MHLQFGSANRPQIENNSQMDPAAGPALGREGARRAPRPLRTTTRLRGASTNTANTTQNSLMTMKENLALARRIGHAVGLYAQ